MKKTFDEAGRELAIKHGEIETDEGPLPHPLKMNGFLAGRDSCKEALRVACRALEFYSCAWDGEANRAIAQVKEAGCYVGEE